MAKATITVLNNCDYNIDQNNRDYDFCHNRAAQSQFIISALWRLASTPPISCNLM